MPLLDRDRCRLLVVDIQEKLLPAMDAQESFVRNAAIVLQSARTLGVPTLISEQYPDGLGATIAPITSVAPDVPRLPKTTFSCALDPRMREWFDQNASGQIVLIGLEAHVCVLQTAMDLQRDGFEVFVVADAVSSRKAASVQTAVARLASASVSIVTTEMVVFEWMRTAASPHFKALSKLIR